RYSGLLFHEISKRLDSVERVEDLVQDIFLSGWEKRGIYKPTGDIYPYHYGMAINRILTHYRSYRVQPQFVAVRDNLPPELAELEELSMAFQQAHREELECLLEQAVTSLPPRMRQVYALRYEENKTINEVASTLSTSPNTVHNQLKIIRKRFTDSLRNTSFLLV